MSPTQSHALLALRVALSVTGVGLVGCDLANPGNPVRARTLNFPIDLTIAGEPDEATGARPFLLVENSNFDLHFGSGTLQSFSLSVLHELARDPERCTATANSWCRIPSELLVDASTGLVVDEVLIASHSDGMELSSDGRRIYVVARSQGQGLSWLDFDAQAGSLSCGSGDGDPYHDNIERCDAAHRSFDGAPAAARGLTLPTDPVALVVGRQSEAAGIAELDGDFIVVAHRNGNASLFLDDLQPGRPPRLIDVISGVPNDIVSAELAPDGLVWLTSGALAASRQTNTLVALAPVLGRRADGTLRSELAIAERLALRGIDDGYDTRDIAFDDTGRVMWVLSRAPEAIVTIPLDQEPLGPGQAPIGRIHPVGLGPSRLERGTIGGRSLLFASCYDARTLWVVDPDLGPIATVAGFDGPFEVAIDEPRQAAYVVDFRFSVLWVVDLAPLATGGSPVIIAQVGSGRAPSVFRQ